MKDKLYRIKQELQKQEHKRVLLQKEQQRISKRLEKLINIQETIIEYNNCKNNSHIAVAVIAMVGTMFLTHNILDQEIINSLLISLGTSTVLSLSTHKFFKTKREKIEKRNPLINFEKISIDDNQKKIQNLLGKQIENSKKLEDIKKTNKKCGQCFEELTDEELIECELINPEKNCNKEKEEKTKEKILVMTLSKRM